VQAEMECVTAPGWRRTLTYSTSNWLRALKIESRVAQVAGIRPAAEQTEEPVEQALRRRDSIGMAIGAEKGHF
jgi:hypothetical protein